MPSHRIDLQNSEFPITHNYVIELFINEKLKKQLVLVVEIRLIKTNSFFIIRTTKKTDEFVQSESIEEDGSEWYEKTYHRFSQAVADYNKIQLEFTDYEKSNTADGKIINN